MFGMHRLTAGLYEHSACADVTLKMETTMQIVTHVLGVFSIASVALFLARAVTDVTKQHSGLLPQSTFRLFLSCVFIRFISCCYIFLELYDTHQTYICITDDVF